MISHASDDFKDTFYFYLKEEVSLPYEFPKDPEPVHLDQSIDIQQDGNFSDSIQLTTIKDSDIAEQFEQKMTSEMMDDNAASDHQYLQGNMSYYLSDILAKSHSMQVRSLMPGGLLDPHCSLENAELEIIAK